MRTLKTKLTLEGDHLDITVVKIDNGFIFGGHICGYYKDGHIEIHSGLNSLIPPVKRIVVPTRNIIIETEIGEVLYNGISNPVIWGDSVIIVDGISDIRKYYK